MPRSVKYRDNPPTRIKDHRIEINAKRVEIEQERDELVRLLDRLIESAVFLRSRVRELKKFRTEHEVVHRLLFDAHKALQTFYLKLF